MVDYKGVTIGHCSLLEDIPEEEIPEEEVEEESPEEKEKRERAEQDKKLAIQMAMCIEQCLDSIRPICKMITEASRRPCSGDVSVLTVIRKSTKPNGRPRTSATRKPSSVKSAL